MHDIIAFLKKAVGRDSNSTIMGCYIVKDGSITANTVGLQAGIMMASTIEFNVPADELEAALARMPSVTGIGFDGRAVTLRGGRLKAVIDCVPDEPPMSAAMPEVLQDVPEGFVEALKLANAFTADDGWSSSIRLKPDRVTAMNNRSGIDIVLPGLAVPSPVLLPKNAVEFLIAQTAPAQFHCDGNSIMFRWPDGRWVKTQLYDASIPSVMDTVFDALDGTADVEINDEWRGAFEDAAALSDGTIMLTPTHLRGIKGAGTNDAEIATALPEGHVSYWFAKTLEAVIGAATHWCPTAYPKPALFTGTNVRGLVMGVKR